MSIEERVAQIPGDDGWWKRGSEEDYVKAANVLIRMNFTEDAAIEFLNELYWAAADCFGG